MKTITRSILAVTIAAVLGPMAAACTIDVNDRSEGQNSDVDIRTPVGSLSVQSGADARDTGLPVYPGAREARNDGDERQSANVNVGNSLFGVKVVAAKFESDDEPQKLVEFYRREMAKYGGITECRGEVDFKGHDHRATCDEQPSSREMQLVVGTDERQRIVAVKPLGSGSEFSLVYVETRGER